MTREALEQALSQHLPEGTVVACADLVIENHIFLKITRSRLSKYGDYRAPSNGSGHRISINYNLNPYMFLITFIHEVAHLTTFKKFNHRVEPHGLQWKAEFKVLLDPFIRSGAFPADIRTALENYMRNPSATSCADPHLVKTLRNYDPNDHYTFLENLPEGCHFRMKGYANTFIKGKLLRKSFQCPMKDSKRVFRISGVAEVQQLTLF